MVLKKKTGARNSGAKYTIIKDDIAGVIPRRDIPVKDIPVRDIRISENIRKEYTGIDELSESIRQHGLLQPITVYTKDDGYIVKSGHRRFKAYLSLFQENPNRFHSIRCIESNADNIAVIQLVENVQREDLSQIDLYNALCALREQGMTLREIAELMGKSEVYVKNLFVGVNDIQRNDKLKELLGSAGTTIQDVKETKGIPDEQERLKLLKQHNTGETTRAEMRKKAKDLKTASSKVSTAPVSTESVSIVPGRIPALRVESAINLEIKVNSEDKSIVVSVTDFREPDLPALKNIIRDAIKKSEKYYIHDVTEDFQRKFEDGREDDS